MVNGLVKKDLHVSSMKDFSEDRKMSLEDELNREGFRVIAVAYKEIDKGKKVFEVKDESELILVGFLAFFDPPKSKQTDWPRQWFAPLPVSIGKYRY